MDRRDTQKRRAAERAVQVVDDGQVVGLGTGSTAAFATQALAQRVRDGLRITGVPTSEATATLARTLGIPLCDLNDVEAIDVTIDGADEVDPAGNLIKGGGGALTREKLVAMATRLHITVVDETKLVARLGDAFALPVEVLPFGWRHTLRRLETLGCIATLRGGESAPLRTDNGNVVVDCQFPGIADPAALERTIERVTGVLACGLFIGLTHRLIVASERDVQERVLA